MRLLLLTHIDRKTPCELTNKENVAAIKVATFSFLKTYDVIGKKNENYKYK